MNSHNLIAINWNANGLKKQRNSFAAFLSHHNVDIACVSETHLINSDTIKFSGYKIYRYDRPLNRRPAGGVAIIIRNNIKYNQMPIISDLRSLEVIAISLTINNKLITLISAYQSPSKPMYTKDYETIFSKNNNIILLGDLNSKHSNWGCISTNSRGRKLQEFINSNSGVISAPFRQHIFQMIYIDTQTFWI
jgi:exonuclease III